MVFILGKSGSGKSTLLNLIGGIDKESSGEIIVDGKSMANFTEKDYQEYRKNYLGFIFQEFNLLSDFNAKDNLALALELDQATNSVENLIECLNKVGLKKEYLTRQISELSGGERQRVAIARAVLKNSKMILADEPTGNLDSKTAKSIWELIKSLSKDRLILVVTHDRENAFKYGDRVIEISDGQVISDTGSQPENSNYPQNVVQNSRLSFKTRLKMGLNNLKLKKGKTALAITLSILSILSILITQMLMSFSAGKTLTSYIKDENVDYFTVAQGFKDKNVLNTYEPMFMKKSTKDYILENAQTLQGSIIKDSQQLIDFGFLFVGDFAELDSNSFYATTTAIEQIYNSGMGMVLVDGEFQSIIKELHPIDFLVVRSF